MILILTGSHYIPFDRLLNYLKSYLKRNPKEEIVIQAGESKIVVPGAKKVSYIPHKDLIKLIKKARVVVTHAGPATILEILKFSQCRPIVVPRRKKFFEHVSDHQWYFASYLKRRRIVTLAESENALLISLDHPNQVLQRTFGENNKDKCLERMRSYISSIS
jgi:UDP-N-acetylglucosamine transferase subunit ALG13